MENIQNKKNIIASRLSLARQNAGLSQGQVAKMLKMHRPTISEIEAGRRKVTIDELKVFSQLYKVNLNWLIAENEEEFNPKKDRIELAARELAKLKPDEFDKVLNLLSSLRDSEG